MKNISLMTVLTSLFILSCGRGASSDPLMDMLTLDYITGGSILGIGPGGGGGAGGGGGTGAITRVSVDSAGGEGNGISWHSAISADGRYVAFESYAANLVASDANGTADIFVHDRQTGETSRVSVDSSGIEGNGFSWLPSISADGRYIAFVSNASNLVPGDTNGNTDVFVYDRQTGITERVSVSSGGAQAGGPGGSQYASISGDGRYVAFDSNASNLVPGDTGWHSDVFIHDRQTRTTIRITAFGIQGNYDSLSPTISDDGGYVAFASKATNLVSGDTNGVADVYVYARQTGAISRVSVDSLGAQGDGDSQVWTGNSHPSSISGDGRYVAFASRATNLASGDTNGVEDVFVHDRMLTVTTRISVDSTGVQGNAGSGLPSISADGRYVAFESTATNLVAPYSIKDIILHDRQTGATRSVTGVSAITPVSSFSSISADGRYIAFDSGAENFVPEDMNKTNDVFVVPNL